MKAKKLKWVLIEFIKNCNPMDKINQNKTNAITIVFKKII